MPNPVMVTLDGSEKDARALAVAAALSRLSGDDLHLVRVFDTPVEGLPRAGVLGVAGAAAEQRAAVQRALADTAGRLETDAGRPVTSEVLDGADVAGALSRHAAARDARVVVMGTRAAGAVGRALRGSVADRVMRECPRPVVLVPPGANFMGGKRVEVGRVLVPLDGSALAARSLDFLLGLPNAKELEYVLLEVVPPGAERERAEAERRLEEAADRARSRGAKTVEVAVLEADDPAGAIVAAVRDALVELIAMSTRGAGGLRRIALGSVAEGVVRSSEIPVLLLTPTDLAAR